MAVTLGKIADTLGTLKNAANHYGASYPSTLAHFLKLYWVERYRRIEIFRLGIADPATPPDLLARLISPRRATKMQKAINPQGYEYVTEDKGVFHQFCLGAGIPTPRLYAIFDPSIGWTQDGKALASKDDWVPFFQEDAPDHLVIKPTWGIRGKSVFVLSREQGLFTDYAGQRYTAADLVETLASHPDFDRFLVQERLWNHSDLVEMTDTTALQTIRIVTGVDMGGGVRILFAVLRLAVGSNPFDTFLMGRTGNFLAELDVDRGTIAKAVAGSESEFGLREVEVHPTTGIPVYDFQVPYWEEVRDTVTDAARKFLPIRTIGWDVAVTPDGPVIVEGNFLWGIDLHCAVRNVEPFFDYAKGIIGATGKGRLPDTNPSRRW